MSPRTRDKSTRLGVFRRFSELTSERSKKISRRTFAKSQDSCSGTCDPNNYDPVSLGTESLYRTPVVTFRL